MTETPFPRSDARSGPWFTDDTGTVRLVYKACLKCGRQTFPPQPYGCLECGAYDADVFVDRHAEATGTLAAQVTVHLHPDQPTPFRIAEIDVRGTSLCVQAPLASEEGLDVGDRVHAVVLDNATLAFAAPQEGRS
ncbi:zinc ribbon domain-containing protein [Streptomyces werraensis]|uniref:zinc ribbon domain-containing protein n=1 Tax=Streptomyces werraensis TaxID=68284 RepID=UPI001CE28C7C